MTARSVLGFAIAASIACATATWAQSPMMSTSPTFGAAACGTPEDVCIPSLDIFANPPGLPPASPPTILTAFLGLVPGDDVTGLSGGLDAFTGVEPILVSVDSTSIGAAGTGVFAESAGGDQAGDIYNNVPDASGAVTSYQVTNGAFVRRHCTAFTSCVHKFIAGGTGAKLVCKPGTPTTCP